MDTHPSGNWEVSGVRILACEKILEECFAGLTIPVPNPRSVLSLC